MTPNSQILKTNVCYSVVGLLFMVFFSNPFFAQHSNKLTKPRIVVTADPELDDNNSLIRFLLYSSDMKIEGLVYASSGYHWKGDGKGTKWYVPGREYSRFGLNLCPCESWRWSKDEQFIRDAVGQRVAFSYQVSKDNCYNPGQINRINCIIIS